MESTAKERQFDLSDVTNNNNMESTNGVFMEEGNRLLNGSEEKPLETEREQVRRKYSLWIMYFTTLLQSIGGSIVVTGMWPYLQKLDVEAEKNWYSVIVAANPLGQLIFAPLIGWWCNRVNAVRIPSVFCLVAFILSNIWYALLPLHNEGGRYYVFAARFLVGVSSGSITACRTFVTQGTLVKERTAAISHLSLAQALGFILGPAVQAALIPLGEIGFPMGTGRLSFSMYTSVGWVTAFLGLVNLIAFHPRLFMESDIAALEAKRDENKTKSLTKTDFNWASISPDYIGLFSIVVTFFIIFFNFVLLETLGTPVSIDQFGWSFPQAIRNVGYTMMISSVVSTSIFFLIPILAQRYDERNLLILCGIVPTIIGRILFFPFVGDVAPLRTLGCFDGTAVIDIDQESCLDSGFKWDIIQHGCPLTQTWCFTIPALNPIIVAVGYAACTLGFPFCIALSQTIFSKMIGPRPQGLWMGGLTAVSSLSRVIGPISVTQIYTRFGTIATSGTATGLMLFTLALLLIVYKRLVPFKLPSITKNPC